MASFNGLDMGPAVMMQTTAAPAGRKVYSFPGVNGVFSTFQGSRGGATEAFGVCWGETVEALVAVEQGFRDCQISGIQADLVDTAGTTWEGVSLIEFRPVEQIVLAPGFGYARAYRMEFFHFGT